eukprot:2072304-Alexandrium_andersonii.AAC.2
MGVNKDHCAAMLFDLCNAGHMGSGTIDQQLKRCWLQMRAWLKSIGKSVPRRVWPLVRHMLQPG